LAETPTRGRVVKAVHGRREVRPDPEHEIGLAASLREKYGLDGLVELYARFAFGDGFVDAMMRRVIWRAGAKRCGHGLHVGSGVGFTHLETFEIGDGVFIGAQAFIQGRYDGTCVIGNNVWIGPQAYFDARDLELGDEVGWGPSGKVLGSAHTGDPTGVPIIRTDLEIKPVRIGAWADIGTNATILPGARIGKGAIIGAGAVVVTDSDIPDFAVASGVPARVTRRREEKRLHKK
jgi:acetyltransferase-like isoleucine patch superfamily enzyme